MAYYFIDALRNHQDPGAGRRMFANAQDGDGVALTYSFLTSVPAGTTNYFGNPSASFETYTDAEKTLIRSALALFEAVANVKFTESNADPDIKFGQFDINDPNAGYAAHPIYDLQTGAIVHGADRGDVWLDSAAVSGNLFLAMHEIGHAMGLQHPFGLEFKLPTEENNTDNTVMSYTQGAQQPTSLQLFDIIALQSIYGPAKARLTDDTYVFGAEKLIWDGGGEDTITAKTAAQSVAIDLNDGSWNHAGALASSLLAAGQVYLGNFTEIENVIGSDFGDELTGNELANDITGGGGGDTLSGGKGKDTFFFLALTDSTSKVDGQDAIEDFVRKQRDVVDLSAIDANTGKKNDQAFVLHEGTKFSGKSGDLIFSDKGDDTLLRADVDGDRKADFAVLFEGHINFADRDFVL